MISPLWRREMHDAQRHWWRRSWWFPTLCLCFFTGALVVLRDGRPWFEPGDFDLLVVVLLRPLAWGVPLWMIWRVTAAFAGTRALGERWALAVTPLSPRSIVLSKTLASARWGFVAVIAGALVVAVWLVEMRWRDAAAQLGLYHWHRWLETRDGGSSILPHGVMLLLPTAQMMLTNLVAVTLAAWVAARRRRFTSAFLISAVLWFVVALLPLVAQILMEFVVGWDLLGRRRVWDEVEVARVEAVYARWEILLQGGTALALPVAWLAYWWRWTGRRFGEVYFREE